MESPFDVEIDSDTSSGYVVSIYQEGEIVDILVATTYDIAEGLVDTILEDDEDEVFDGCSIRPIKFDTINQFHTEH